MAERRRSLAMMASPLVVGRIASMAVTFALPLALARLLDAHAFGAYKQLFLVSQTVLLVCQLGLTPSLYYFLPREHGRRTGGAYVAQALLGLGALASLVLALVLLLGPVLARHMGGGELGALSTPLALLASGLLLSSALEAALTSLGRVGAAALTYVLSDAARATLLLLGARYDGLRGIAWAAAAWAALRVVALAATLIFRIVPLGRPARTRLREQLAYALPFAGSVLLLVAQRQFVQYAVAISFDSAAFALFAVAAFHMPMVDIVFSPVSEVLMVQLGRTRAGTSSDRLAAWDDAVEKLAMLLLPAAACAWLFGPTILPMLFTQRYAAAVPLFAIVTLEIPLWAVPADSLLRATGRTRFLFGWYAARLAITAGAVLGGMRLAGLAGAIAGSVASEAMSRLVVTIAGRSALGVPVRRIFDPALLRIAFSAAAAALPALVMQHLLAGRAALFVGAAAYLVAYASLFLALRAPRRAFASAACA